MCVRVFCVCVCVCVCVCKWIKRWVGVAMVFRSVPVIRSKTFDINLCVSHEYIYTHAYTHTPSDVTHTRHTIVADTSSEKREVDSLHHEK
mmetsp:Transcript_61690/g.90467  ORF Transcript_61690/g.90467 Transcript_61690/m.90467 type:complete len:90 (-) Transcript_61690:61-330(-)